MEEIIVRYIHHDDNGSESCTVNTSGGARQVTVWAEGSNTVLVEMKCRDLIQKLQIIQVEVVHLEPTWFDRYEFIEELDVDCAVPIHWIFSRLSYWTHLKTVRFTKGAFKEVPLGMELYLRTFCCPSVAIFELDYDPSYQDQLTVPERELIHGRIEVCVRSAQFSFYRLEYCRIVLPLELENVLQFFIDSFPHIRGAGEKLTRYADGTVTFTNMEPNTCSGRRQSAPAPVNRESLLCRLIARRCSAPAVAVPKISPVVWYRTRRTNKDQFLSVVPLSDLPVIPAASPSSPPSDPPATTQSWALQRRDLHRDTAPSSSGLQDRALSRDTTSSSSSLEDRVRHMDTTPRSPGLQDRALHGETASTFGIQESTLQSCTAPTTSRSPQRTLNIDAAPASSGLHRRATVPAPSSSRRRSMMPPVLSRKRSVNLSPGSFPHIQRCLNQ